MTTSCVDYEREKGSPMINNDLFEESFLTLGLDCSLSYADLTVSDSVLNLEYPGTELPSPSTSVLGGERINFSDVLQGLNVVQQNSDKTFKGSVDQVKEAIPTKTAKSKSKLNGIKKGQRYNPSFKQKVMKYAVKHTFKQTSDKFNINCNTLTEWAREYKRLLQLKKSTTIKPGFKCKTEICNNLANHNETDALSQRLSCDANFIAWLRSKRLNGIKVKRDEVLTAGLEFLQSNPDGPPWFASWLNRLSQGSPAKSTRINHTDKHIFYSHNFKTEVALYANEYTKSAAAKTFGLSTRRLYEWCDIKKIASAEAVEDKSITAMKQSVESQLQHWYHQKRVLGARPNSTEVSVKARALYAANGLSHLKCSQGWLDKIKKKLNIQLCHSDDEPLLLWVLAQLDNNHSLSVQDVTCKARHLAVQSGVSTFKGSKGWTLRFLKRHSYVLQCTSARLSYLPAAAAEQARMFLTYLQHKMIDSSLPSDNVGCMDEVPITFHFPTDKVQTPRLLRRVCLEAAHAVVLLAATSNGLLLPPAVVLKGNNPMQTFQLDGTSILVFYHPLGSVHQAILKDWCEHIWFRYVKSPNMLVLDSFTPHQDSDFQEWLVSRSCHPAIIPAGCAVHLQPCSFNLSHNFQEAVREKWLEYTSEASSTEWKHKRVPDDAIILKWVVNAYHALRGDTYSISSSFHLSGLIKPRAATQAWPVHNE